MVQNHEDVTTSERGGPEKAATTYKKYQNNKTLTFELRFQEI